MKLPKEQQKIMNEIFDMLEISNTAMRWKISIPRRFLCAVKVYTLDDIKLIDYLNEVSIELSASETTLSSSQINTICVLFGKRKIIDKEKNRITLNFKYAPLLIYMIANSIQPISFTIETKPRRPLKYLRYIDDE